MLEAMACGTRVLISGVGSVTKIIEDGYNGLILESNDPPMRSNRIIQLLDDPHSLRRIAGNALRYVASYFDFAKVLAIWIELLVRLLDC